MRSVALLAAALLMAGCVDPVAREPLPEAWRGRDLSEPGWANETLQPGWTLALESEWSAGRRVQWDWFVYEPIFVHFQIVRMDGDEPGRPLVAYDRQEDSGERTIVQSGTHQVDWMNEFGEPVTVAYKVPGSGARILYPPGQGPGCLIAQARTAGVCLAAPDLPVA